MYLKAAPVTQGLKQTESRVKLQCGRYRPVVLIGAKLPLYIGTVCTLKLQGDDIKM